MSDFLSDAPAGALILLGLGVFLEFVIATFLQVKVAIAVKKRAELAMAGVVSEETGIRGLMLVHVAGVGCMASGLVWYGLA